MLLLWWLSAILAPTALAASITPETSLIHISGNKFYDEAGNRFLLKGIAYQRQMPGHEHEPYPEIQKGYIDSLAHPEKCLRDIELLKELHVNTIRVYQVDPDQKHDACMHALARNGIYVLVDLLEPKHAINRKDPSWHLELFRHFRAVIDRMHGFDNVLGFIAGNEVVTSSGDSGAAAAVKAAIRDAKKHIASQGYRAIPVGYAANDDETTRTASLEYFTCKSADSDSDSAFADFYAINMFEWCGYLTFATSGLRERTKEFAHLAVPVFLSEFGCNSVRPRPFTETEALYGPEMAGVWLGGVAYEFFENENHYGVVAEKAPGRLQKLAEFDTLKMRFAARAREAEKEDPRAKSLPRACLGAKNDAWRPLTKLPPTPEEKKCKCVEDLVTCVSSHSSPAFDSPELLDVERALLEEVCGVVDCSAISEDPRSGVYGELSGCAPRTKLAWALSQAGGSCDFSGRAKKKEEKGSFECEEFRDLVAAKVAPVVVLMEVKPRAKAFLQPLRNAGNVTDYMYESVGGRSVTRCWVCMILLLALAFGIEI